MSTVVIKTNASQGTDVLIRDMGIVIPSGGGSETLTDRGNIQNAYDSDDLRTYCTDDAHGIGSSTLILNDGSDDIPQGEIEGFLEESAGVRGPTGMAGETGPTGVGQTGLQGVTGNANIGRGESPFPASPQDRQMFWHESEQIFYFYEGVTAMAWIDISSGSKVGNTGSQGVTGLPGEAALQGATGAQGFTGITGETGVQGVTGTGSGLTGATLAGEVLHWHAPGSESGMWLGTDALRVKPGSGGIHTVTVTGVLEVNGDVIINADGSTEGDPRRFGFTGFSAGEAARLEFGDPWNALQNAFGQSMQMSAYHTIILAGYRSTDSIGQSLDWEVRDVENVLIDNDLTNRTDAVVLGLRGTTGQEGHFLHLLRSDDSVMGVLTKDAALLLPANVKIGPTPSGYTPTGGDLMFTGTDFFGYNGNTWIPIGATGLQGHTGVQGSTGVQGTTGISGAKVFEFFADQMDAPVSSDWGVTGIAPLNADSNNSALLVKRFDDTSEEGAGFILEIPSDVTQMGIQLRSRAETAPGSSQDVVPRLYVREVPDNGSVESWSAGTDLTAISFPTNENFQYDSQTLSLSSLGLVAGRVAQFEITRNTGSGSDTLTGDWTLLEVKVEFS